jgi:hypothetical protein
MDADSQSLERSLLELEGRVRALEETVAGLQQRQIEEHIVERANERVTAQAPHVPVATIVEGITNQPLPPAVKTIVGVATQPSTLRQVAQSSWLAFDMVHELITVGRMLVDPHYHMAWLTRFLVIAFALALVLSAFWFPLAWNNWLGSILDKLFDLLLAAVLFLALFCETRRYKEWRQR